MYLSLFIIQRINCFIKFFLLIITNMFNQPIFQDGYVIVYKTHEFHTDILEIDIIPRHLYGLDVLVSHSFWLEPHESSLLCSLNLVYNFGNLF